MILQQDKRADLPALRMRLDKYGFNPPWPMIGRTAIPPIVRADSTGLRLRVSRVGSFPPFWLLYGAVVHRSKMKLRCLRLRKRWREGLT